MSTHVVPCVWCGKESACPEDTHALGAGPGGCYDEGPKIEFCSVACFKALRDSMARREQIFKELHAEQWT